MNKFYNFTAKSFEVEYNDDKLQFGFTGYDMDCRDGYNQYGELVIYHGNFKRGSFSAKSHIINRSWEAYGHQNVYISCIRQLMDFRANLMKKLVIEGAGKKRMCASLKEDLEKAIQNDEIYMAASKILDELKK